jgi:hypothetical protein
MGANTGNRGQISAARQQQAMEGQAMRRRAIQQQTQASPAQEQGVAPAFAPQAPMGRGPAMGGMSGMGGRPEMDRTVGMGRMPEIPSGINFGPGRANRTPEPGSPEYEQLLQRVRGLGQMRR